MAETFKKNNLSDKIKMGSRGSVLVISLLVLGIMLFLGSYFISFGLAGAEMSNSHVFAAQAYYLAEAGIGEAIFKLKNDPTWKSAFETKPTISDPNCSSWSIAPYQRTGGLFSNGSYTITITNLGCAKAEIKAQASLQLSSGKTAQRIVKTKVFKAMGNPISEFNIFSGGPSENIVIRFVNPLNLHGGNLFSNKNLQVRDWSVVRVEKKALANGIVNISTDSQLNATAICSANICQAGCNVENDCPPDSVSMPPLDFDSKSPSSFLSRAQASNCSLIRQDGKTNCVFTPAEFERAMWQNYPELSLPPNTTTYITGDVNIRAGQQLTVNGVLAADRDLNLGEDFCWTMSLPPFLRCGNAQLTAQRPGAPEDNLPSGILAKRKLNAGGWLGIGLKALDVTGLIYAGDEARFSSVIAPIRVRGGIAARKLNLSSLRSGVDIYLDSDVIVDTFGNPSYSPMIIIDHWEEEY